MDERIFLPGGGKLFNRIIPGIDTETLLMSSFKYPNFRNNLDKFIESIKTTRDIEPDYEFLVMIVSLLYKLLIAKAPIKCNEIIKQFYIKNVVTQSGNLILDVVYILE